MLNILFTSKKRLLIFLVLVFIVVIIFVFGRREKVTYGHVSDCNTGEPVDSAEVSVDQRGWGIDNGRVVWDKDYISVTKTDATGYFKVSYRVGSSVDLVVRKKGYITAEQYEDSGKEVTVKMLQGDKPTEVTYNCILSSRCLLCTVEAGVETCRNICLQR